MTKVYVLRATVCLIALSSLVGCFRIFGYESANQGLIDDGGPDADGDVDVDADSDVDVDGDVDADAEERDGDQCVPEPEVCNGLDDDCDDQIDEDFECIPGTTASCSYCGMEGTQSCSEDCLVAPCDAVCPAELPDCCDDTCVDTYVDSSYCGTCDIACDEEWECIEGICQDMS